MTFGRLISEATPDEILAAERGTAREHFAPLDSFMTEALRRMILGELVLDWELDGARIQNLEIPWTPEDARQVLDERYAREAIEARGAWFLPQKGKVRPGWVSLFRILDQEPKFGVGHADSVSGSLPLDGSTTILSWSLLTRMAADLFAPFELRGPMLGKLDRKELGPRFEEYTRLLDQIGLDVGDTLHPFMPGSNWRRLSAAEKIEARIELRRALADTWNPSAGPLLRAGYLGQLVRRYYDRADGSGNALRKRVISKQFVPDLVFLFGGDWLEMLSYIEESPHPDEEVVQALPAPSLYVADVGRVTEVAASAGVDDAEIEKIATALYGTTELESPVRSRVRTLRRLWSELDAAHARQASGMAPLPDFRIFEVTAFPLVDDPYASRNETQTFEAVFDKEVLADVNRLWSTAVFDRWPERLYTETLPFTHVANALGPAIEFWNGVALTAWYVAEGPYSRTSIEGMPKYYSTLATTLREIGHPIDPTVFEDLMHAEKLLGPPIPVTDEVESIGPLTISFSTGSRREGFEHLRDVVSEHRRRWADAHLDTYLERWRTDLEDAHTEYQRHLANTGRAPTAKQFAKMASTTANNWFGGDLSGVYSAIGEVAPISSTYERMMPAEPESFAKEVFFELGGTPLQRSDYETDGAAGQQRRASVYRAADAARGALRLVQCREAKGQDPTIPEFGTGRWRRFAELFSTEEAAAWEEFRSVVDTVLSRPIPSPRAEPSQSPKEPSHSPTASPGVATSHRSAAATSPTPPRSKKSLFDRLLGR